MASTTWSNSGPSAPAQDPPVQLLRRSSEDRQRKSQTRQRLSCTKCRERKVKCDRTKPCSACCARGHPRDCEFIVGEGNDYGQIQQSYEIRKLRAENERLKERLQNAQFTQSGDEDDEGDHNTDRKGAMPTSRAAASRQRRFRTGDRVDNLYFGTPGLASIVSDFARLQIREVGSDSLVHTLPRGRDMYAPTEGLSAYPFPRLGQANTSIQLAQNLLTSREDVFSCLDMFQRRAQSCYFPHMPDEMTRKEVERFLADIEGNAERFPDMLALIFATLATGMQMGVHDRHGGAWVPGAIEESRSESDVYLAASMEALRNASFLNSPTLLVIQTLIMIGPYLTNSGRFLDAWTLFGTTIRAAHSIGLHRDPRLLDPSPPLRDSNIRRTLWWWMLHMDQQYSVTLGRPLGISGFGDCPPPEPLTTNPTMLRLGEFINHFTILARQILSSDGMMLVSRIDEYTDKLLGLWDTMPEALQFNEAWLQQNYELPDWPLEVMSATLFAQVHSFLILLNRQRVERTQANTRDSSPAGFMGPPPRPGSSFSQPDHPAHMAPVRGRSLAISSSVAILHTFLFLHHRKPAVLICWTMGQQAFNACMILLLDACETESERNQSLIEQAFAVFGDLESNGVHKLAELAVRRISDGLLRLGSRRRKRERAALSRRSSSQPGYHGPPALTIDTTAMPSFPEDAVMGNTGMFLLEDNGLQGHVTPSFQPLSWHMANSAFPMATSHPVTSGICSPALQVSHTAKVTSFPMVSSPFISPTTPSLTPLTYGVNYQTQRSNRPPSTSTQSDRQQAAFTPVNTHIPAQDARALNEQPFSRLHSSRPHVSNRYSSAAAAGPRGIIRPDRSLKSQQRRK